MRGLLVAVLIVATAAEDNLVYTPCNGTEFMRDVMAPFLSACGWLMEEGSTENCAVGDACSTAFEAMQTTHAAICLYEVTHTDDETSEFEQPSEESVAAVSTLFTQAMARCRVLQRAEVDDEAGYTTEACGQRDLAVFSNNEVVSFYHACRHIQYADITNASTVTCGGACDSAWEVVSRHVCLPAYVASLRDFIERRPHELLARDNMFVLDVATEHCGSITDVMSAADQCHEAQFDVFRDIHLPTFFSACKPAFSPGKLGPRCSDDCKNAVSTLVHQPECLLRWDAAVHAEAEPPADLVPGTIAYDEAVALGERKMEGVRKRIRWITDTEVVCNTGSLLDTAHRWRKQAHAYAREIASDKPTLWAVFGLGGFCLCGVLGVAVWVVQQELRARAGLTYVPVTAFRSERRHSE